jgi:Mad3/BUB1 homology region 1
MMHRASIVPSTPPVGKLADENAASQAHYKRVVRSASKPRRVLGELSVNSMRAESHTATLASRNTHRPPMQKKVVTGPVPTLTVQPVKQNDERSDAAVVSRWDQVPAGLSVAEASKRQTLVSQVQTDSSQPQAWVSLLERDLGVLFRRGKNFRPESVQPLLNLCEQAQQAIPMTTYLRDNAYMKLWIMYAKLQMITSLSKARDTFLYLERHQIGRNFSHFYKSWAELEQKCKNPQRAAQILAIGAERGAIRPEDVPCTASATTAAGSTTNAATSFVRAAPSTPSSGSSHVSSSTPITGLASQLATTPGTSGAAHATRHSAAARSAASSAGEAAVTTPSAQHRTDTAAPAASPHVKFAVGAGTEQAAREKSHVNSHSMRSANTRTPSSEPSLRKRTALPGNRASTGTTTRYNRRRAMPRMCCSLFVCVCVHVCMCVCVCV